MIQAARLVERYRALTDAARQEQALVDERRSRMVRILGSDNERELTILQSIIDEINNKIEEAAHTGHDSTSFAYSMSGSPSEIEQKRFDMAAVYFVEEGVAVKVTHDNYTEREAANDKYKHGDSHYRTYVEADWAADALVPLQSSSSSNNTSN